MNKETKKVALDNHGRPRSEYLDRIASMNDVELSRECGSMIWLSAYAVSNPVSDYHWQCDVTYDECTRRGRPEIYVRAHARMREELS